PSSRIDRRSPHRDPHSFPTRRSSDLARAQAPAGDGSRVAVEAFSRGDAIDRDWMGWGALRVLSRQDWAPGATRDDGRVANMERLDRKSTRLNSSHVKISYAVFCLKKQ